LTLDLIDHSWTGLHIRVQQSHPIPLDAELLCEPGKLTALVGPSGSGKTTLLRSIAGLYRPRHGKVRCGAKQWLDTERDFDIPTQKRRVGFVFQDFALFPHMTVLDNVKIAVHPSTDRPNSTKHAIDVLRRVNLTGLEHRYPKMLSGGQQQRVALARALAREPAVLLLDEPFSAVDQVTRRKLRLQTLQLTRRLNIPIVLVTHDLDEAAMLADQMCVLHRGQTLQCGTPEEIRERPTSTLVARLVDIRNLFEGSVAEQKPDEDLTRLNCNGCSIDARCFAEFNVNDKVCWCISPSSVLLHSRLRPSNGEKENPFSGEIIELVTIAGISSVTVDCEELNACLTMDLPRHVVFRNQLSVGYRISFSLLKDSIHLMPWKPLNDSKDADNDDPYVSLK